jgi:hypothetical protein
MYSYLVVAAIVHSGFCAFNGPSNSFNRSVQLIEAYPYHTIIFHCNGSANDIRSSLIWIAPWYQTATQIPGNFSTMKEYPYPVNDTSQTWTFEASPQLFQTSLRLFPNGTISIGPMRGAFLGEWKCFSINSSGGLQLEHVVVLEPETFIMKDYVTSLIVGLTSLGGALVMGIIVGSVRFLYENKCSKAARRHKHKPAAFLGVIPVPLEEDDSVDGEAQGPIYVPVQGGECLLGEADMTESIENSLGLGQRNRSSSSLNADVDLVFTDEQVAEEYQQVLDSLAQSQNDPTRFSERMEELRTRLRSDVGRRVKIMRSRMRTLRTESANCMSRAVQSLGSTSALAAQKMRNGFATSVYAMKGQMRSVAELCGSVHVGQTISIVSITKQEDGEEKEVILKNYTFG